MYVETTSTDAVAALAIGFRAATNVAIASGAITGAMINNNIVSGAVSTNSIGNSAAGIIISGAAAGLPNTLQNNIVYNVSSQAKANAIVAGIYVVGAVASVTKVYHNTVSLSGDRGSESQQYPSYCIALSGLDPSLDMKNNILSTTQIVTGGGLVKTYAFGTASTTFDNLISDYNVYYSGGVQDDGFRSGSLNTNAGTSYATLAAWSTAIADDTHSVEVIPVFLSPTDLHLDANNNPLIAVAGTPIASVIKDIDCQVRNTVSPTIGADEISAGVLGTNYFDPLAKFRFYPNPVKSILNIENDSPISKVEIFALTGQNILNKEINTESAQIDLFNLSAGTYFVRVSCGNNIKTFKIIKE